VLVRGICLLLLLCKVLVFFELLLYLRSVLTRDRSAPLLQKNPELKAQWEALIPQGKMGDPEDLMGAVVFLSSEASKYVTGIEIIVDGGFTST